jgi:hypothetical protein
MNNQIRRKGMRRAIVVYLENQRDLMLQFGCLYTSLKHIQAKDTDLVVFGTREALNKVPSDCVKVESPPVSGRPEWKNYKYINSVSCLVGKEADFLNGYDYILRSDVDTFMTPAWNSYYPIAYSVGRGAYINNEEVRRNIRRVAGILGLTHRGIENIGSTHYGPPKVVRDVCRVTLHVALYILNHEFATGSGQWPGWYEGVTLLYSCEIAVNHVVGNVQLDYGKLDIESTSRGLISNHPHIHCWHTDQVFSKFRFAAGAYDHMPIHTLNTNTVRDYCMYIAVKSKKEMPWLG